MPQCSGGTFSRLVIPKATFLKRALRLAELRPDYTDWLIRGIYDRDPAFIISGGGRFIVYSTTAENPDPQAKSRLFLRMIDQKEAKPIPGMEGGITPFISTPVASRFICSSRKALWAIDAIAPPVLELAHHPAIRRQQETLSRNCRTNLIPAQEHQDSTRLAKPRPPGSRRGSMKPGISPCQLHASRSMASPGVKQVQLGYPFPLADVDRAVQADC
jgi:hypothetical protein